MLSLIIGKLFPFLFSPNKNKIKSLHWQGNNLFELKIVGTSYYRDSIQKITSLELGKNAFIFCNATIMPEDDNQHDGNAVKVVIDGYKVGYLSRDFAVTYRSYFKQFNIPIQSATCDAVITGGFSSNEKIYEFIIELDLPNTPSAPIDVSPSNNNLRLQFADFGLKPSKDGNYQIDAWLDYYAIEDMHPKMRIHSWTTDDWDTVNYYLLNNKGIGLGHKLFSIKKTEHYKLFCDKNPEALLHSINGRIAQITLKP